MYKFIWKNIIIYKNFELYFFLKESPKVKENYTTTENNQESMNKSNYMDSTMEKNTNCTYTTFKKSSFHTDLNKTSIINAEFSENKEMKIEVKEKKKIKSKNFNIIDVNKTKTSFGVIKYYEFKKKFGFIADDNTNNEVFFHYQDFLKRNSNTENQLIKTRQGIFVKVKFIYLSFMSKNKKKIKAVDIEIIE